MGCVQTLLQTKMDVPRRPVPGERYSPMGPSKFNFPPEIVTSHTPGRFVEQQAREGGREKEGDQTLTRAGWGETVRTQG